MLQVALLMNEFTIFAMAIGLILGIANKPISKKIKSLIGYFKSKDSNEDIKEGDVFIILENTEHTKYPEKYSEGVFAWYQDGTIKTSLEFQIDNGGDPIVFKKFLLKEEAVREAQ